MFNGVLCPTSGLVQKPQGQIPQEAAQPPEGAAPEAKGGAGGGREREGGRASLRHRPPRRPAAPVGLVLAPGGGGVAGPPRPAGRRLERHLGGALGQRVGDGGAHGQGGGGQMSRGGAEVREGSHSRGRFSSVQKTESQSR